VSTPLGHVTTTAYDNANEPTTVTDPTGRFTRTSYDLAGRITSTAHGQNTTYANPVTTTTYDLAGRAVSTSDCTVTSTGGCNTVIRTATTAFDGAGRTVQTTTAAGRPNYYGYDTAGQLATISQRVDPANAATAITVNLGYDRDGNKTRMVDGNGNATTYTYTTWNLPESTIEPSRRWTYPSPRRRGLDPAVIDTVLRQARENPRWGYLLDDPTMEILAAPTLELPTGQA
jgi:YD repeat-containing protein